MAATTDTQQHSDDGAFVQDKDTEKAVASMVKEMEMKVEICLPADMPMVARLDGVAFHTFARGLAKPYDVRFIHAMQQTTMDMVENFHCVAAFTVSDEITLVFAPHFEPSKPMYNYRTQKVASVLAGYASARFNKHIADAFLKWPEPEVELHVRERMLSSVACFDARIFSPPTLVAATQALLWRHRYDGPKNAIGTCARHVFGHKGLEGVGCKRMLAMLQEHGKPFSEEHPGFRFGTLVKKGTVMKQAVDRKTQENVVVARTVVVYASAPMHRSYEEEAALIFAERVDLDASARIMPWRFRNGDTAEPSMSSNNSRE